MVALTVGGRGYESKGRSCSDCRVTVYTLSVNVNSRFLKQGHTGTQTQLRTCAHVRLPQIHTCFPLHQLRELRSSDDTPVAMSTCITHILVSNTIPQEQRSGLLGEAADWRMEAAIIADGPENFMEPESKEALQSSPCQY